MGDLVARNAFCAVSADGVTYTLVGGVKSIDHSFSGDTIETSDHDSGVYKSFVGDRLSGTLSCSGNYDEADAGLDIVRTSFFARSLLYYRYRPATGSGYDEYVQQGVLTSFSASAGNDGLIEFSFEAQLTGTTTISTQS